ncbi:MAG: phosphatase PAP2 family protein [Eubacterium sp.]|nr:phosphatase PAP2 family protein [Eubacterium sp.]
MAIDWAILDKIQSMFSSGFMDWLMPRITVLGDAGIIWILMGVILLISKKHRRTGFLVLVGLLIGLIIGNGIVKNLVARSRPCWLDTEFNMLISVPKDYSFPSGHTQASVIAATIITLYRKEWGWVVIPLAVGIAFSRLYLYVHFPTDVLGGTVLGLMIGLVTYYAGNRIISAFMAKKQNRGEAL